jgi:hypothetical protein
VAGQGVDPHRLISRLPRVSSVPFPTAILIAPLRALLGLVPLGAGTLVAVMLAVLLTWARAELSCRWTIEA